MMILGRLVATDTAGLYRTDDGDGDGWATLRQQKVNVMF